MTPSYLPLGCYGKLPFWPEYLSENVAYASSIALKQWLHEGRDEARAGQEDAAADEPRETARLRFLLGAPGSFEILAGVIRPSADQGGLRHFPFAVFAHVPRRAYSKVFHLLPLALAPVWDALDDAWENLSTVATPGAFREVLETSLVPAPASLPEAQSHHRALQQEVADWILAREDGSSLGALLENLPDVLAQLRKAPERLKLELPVRSGLDEACSDTAFWIELLNRQFFWRHFEPNVFLEESPARKDRKTLLVFGLPEPGDYGRILGCGAPEEGILRPALPLPGASLPDPTGLQGLTYGEIAAKRFQARG